MKKLTEEERAQAEIAMNWLGLALFSLRPFITQGEWNHFALGYNSVCRRLGFESIKKSNKDEQWPEGLLEQWESLK